jgi:hypothetical protein
MNIVPSDIISLAPFIVAFISVVVVAWAIALEYAWRFLRRALGRQRTRRHA